MRELMRFEEKVQGEIIRTEDGGQAKIAEIATRAHRVSSGRVANRRKPLPKFNKERGIWMQLISWDEEKHHEDFQKLVGKRVRVIIQIID
jgi:hypothetical protein